MPDAVLVLTVATATGCALVGGVFFAFSHIPRNDTLAALDPNRADAARYWSRYLVSWTAWNHVRTIVPLLAAVALIGGIHAG
jgi:uncharacterized membrane protein